MAKFYSELDDMLRTFIAEQRIFFNASAASIGRINMSPKGMDTFRVINNKEVAYLDLTGSENETAAHIAENGRLTLMFCSFAERPLILRLYGQGRIVRKQDDEWDDYYKHFLSFPGERQIITLAIESVLTTCGFAVPLFEYKGERSLLVDFACKKGEEGMEEYKRERNQKSLDGLPTYLYEDKPT